MVLGANIGSAINPVLEGTGGDPVKLRLPVGNLATRLVGAAIAAAVPRADRRLAGAARAGDPGRLAANFHTAFNLAVAALFIGLLPPMARLLVRLLPARPAAGRSGQAALSRSGRAADAGRGARQRRARGAPHGRRRREDARRHAGRPSTATTATSSPRRAAWTTSSTACTRRCSATSPQIAREGLSEAEARRLDRGAVLRHQPRAYRRHHRQEPRPSSPPSGCG